MRFPGKKNLIGPQIHRDFLPNAHFNQLRVKCHSELGHFEELEEPVM